MGVPENVSKVSLRMKLTRCYQPYHQWDITHTRTMCLVPHHGDMLPKTRILSPDTTFLKLCTMTSYKSKVTQRRCQGYAPAVAPCHPSRVPLCHLWRQQRMSEPRASCCRKSPERQKHLSGTVRPLPQLGVTAAIPLHQSLNKLLMQNTYAHLQMHQSGHGAAPAPQERIGFLWGQLQVELSL